MSTWFLVTLEVSVIASALVAGVFLTFSDFVMKSLAAAKPAGGIESMQIINREVFRTVFMFLFLGMAAFSPFLASYAYLSNAGSVSEWTVAGGILYFLGVFMVTIIFNVPMNKRLDRMEYSGDQTAAYWKNIYVPRWTFWNYVRAIASAGSAVCFLIAGISLAQG